MEFVVGLLVLLAFGWWLWRRRAGTARPELPSAEDGVEVERPAVQVTPRPVPPAEASPPARGSRTGAFAKPGARGLLFVYGNSAGKRGYRHDGVYAVIDVETTGFSPARRPDHRSRPCPGRRVGSRPG